MSGKIKLRYLVSTSSKVKIEGLGETGGNQHKFKNNLQYLFLDPKTKRILVRKSGKRLIKSVFY